MGHMPKVEPQVPTRAADLMTPALLLDKSKMLANIARMASRMERLGGTLRPHVKTNKSIDVTRHILDGGHTQGICVSTLREARYFLSQGINDIMYAVGIAPNKFAAAAALMQDGCDLKIVLDNEDMARLVVEDGERRGVIYKVLIELDTDGHRSGADPKGDELMRIGAILEDAPSTELVGVMTHAGESYGCNDPEGLLAIARQERDSTVLAAERLRAQGAACPVVSIGSTPTALWVDDLSGVTEVRAGVYVFFDLVMAGVGVCEPQDVALSVLSSVIGFQKDRGWVITDGGWMAMSRDRGTQGQAVDYGYGMVLDLEGNPLGDVTVAKANQEHGVLSSASDHEALDKLEVGDLIRVLPNHACSTASQYPEYVVVEDGEIIDRWSRINGW